MNMMSQKSESRRDSVDNADAAQGNNNFLSQLTDSQLVMACLSGDERAWETLLDRYGRLIYTIPIRFGFTRTVADEIFQEVCLILLEKLKTLQDHDRLHPWLVTITRRTCIQRIRQKDNLALLDSIDETADTTNPDALVEDAFLRVEEQTLLLDALANLDDRCQVLLRALFLSEPPPSYEDISCDLNIPLGSIGPTRSRCLEKLRNEIAKLEDVIDSHGQNTIYS